MRRLRTLRFASAAILGYVLVSPASAQEQPPAAKITYKDHVLPIFRARCGSCHNANDRRGDLVLDNYSAAMVGGSSGSVLEAGDADGSYLWQVVTHQSEPVMPPKGDKLPETELNLIKQWIEGGLLENSGSVASLPKKPSLAKVEIKPGQRPEVVAMPSRYLGDPSTIAPHANAVTALATSPWASLAAVSGHLSILLYNTQTLDLLGAIPFPEGQPQVVRFSAAGDLLLAAGGRGGASGRVVVFDVATGERKIEVGEEYDSILAADISPDQSLIALGGPKRMVRVYSTETSEQLYEIKKHTDWVTAAAFSPDGVLLATGDRSNGLVVWEAGSGKMFYDLLGHKGAITDVTWRPDSNVLASASEDGTIKLWDMNNGNLIKSWDAHTGGVSAVDYTGDGNLVSVGRDKLARLWKGDGSKLRDFKGLADIGMEVAFDGESKRVLAGDWTGAVRFWNAEDGTELAQVDTNPPTLAAQLARLTESLAKAETEQQQKAAKTAQLKQQSQDRKNAADQAAARLAAVTQSARQLKDNLRAAEEALQKQRAELDQSTGQMNKATESAEDQKRQLADAAEALKLAEEVLARAKEAVDAAKRGIDAQQVAMNDARQREQAAIASVQDAKADVAKSEAELAQIQTASQEAARSIEAAKALAAKASKEAQPTPEEMKEVEQFQREADAARKQVEELAGRIERLKAIHPADAP